MHPKEIVILKVEARSEKILKKQEKMLQIIMQIS